MHALRVRGHTSAKVAIHLRDGDETATFCDALNSSTFSSQRYRRADMVHRRWLEAVGATPCGRCQ
jgi:hypothetical protein